MPPLTMPGHQTEDRFAALARLFEARLGFLLAQGLSREHDEAAARPVAVDVSNEAIAHLGNEVVFGELVAIEDGERFARQVDHDGVLGDAGHLSENLFADVKGGALRFASFAGTLSGASPTGGLSDSTPSVSPGGLLLRFAWATERDASLDAAARHDLRRRAGGVIETRIANSTLLSAWTLTDRTRRQA